MEFGYTWIVFVSWAIPFVYVPMVDAYGSSPAEAVVGGYWGDSGNRVLQFQ